MNPSATSKTERKPREPSQSNEGNFIALYSRLFPQPNIQFHEKDGIAPFENGSYLLH